MNKRDMGMNVVYVERDRCIACLSCEQVCLFQRSRKVGCWHPGIFVNVDLEQRQIYTGTCLQCETALCMKSCPVSAIKRDPATAAVIVDREICLGCGTCVSACPSGYMQLDNDLGKATKCDLCDGDPKCVQMCMAKALHFGDFHSLLAQKREQTGLRLGLRAVPIDENDQ